MIFRNKIVRSGILTLLVMFFMNITAFGQATTANPGLEGPCTYLNDQITISGIDFNAIAPYLQTYAISDAAGNVLEFSATGTFTVTPTPGAYDLWAFNYNPTAAVPSDPTGLTTVADITTLLATTDVCLEAAGPFTIDVCDAALFTEESFCDSNTNIAVVQAIPGTYNTSYTQEYYLVDASGAIVAGPSTNAQFTNPGVGTYTVYAVNYDPATPITVTNQADLDALTLAADCAEVASGPVEVIVCAMCAIMPDPAANIVCDDNGTPSDDTDDTFTFDITVNGSNPVGTGTFNDDQGNTGVAYGTTLNYGPFPIAGGNIVVNFTDVDDAMCTGMMMGAAPATCSNAMCAIQLVISNYMCDNGGTDNDPSDDMISFDYTVNDIGGIGTTWSSDQGDAGVAYGTVVSVGPVPADGTNWVINVNDDGDANCVDDSTVVLNDCAIPQIPTLSEWGLITLALLLMTLGAVKMAVGSVALAGTGSKNLPMPSGNSFRLPFDMAIFRKALNVTAILAIIGFAICFAIFGSIFIPDIIGVAIAGPIFAYLAHLLYILETK